MTSTLPDRDIFTEIDEETKPSFGNVCILSLHTKRSFMGFSFSAALGFYRVNKECGRRVEFAALFSCELHQTHTVRICRHHANQITKLANTPNSEFTCENTSAKMQMIYIAPTR